jgi:D-glycero-alpha-D-manno-heptose-7-phosphate kinase
VVALLGLLARQRRHPFTDYELAELAWRIEREDLGIRGGKQDQYAAAFGGFNFIEFHPDAVVVNPLRMDQETLNELEYSLLLCYTGRTRLSGRILERQIASYVERRSEVVEALEAQKALAVALKNALLRRQLRDFGGLLHEAWETKKRLDQGISSPAIDEMYDEARRAGAVGGKLLGAGGGGYLLLYCRFDRKHRVAETLERLGGQVVEFGFESRGLQTWEAAS